MANEGLHSTIELNIAIIVSCAPALFGFTRTKVFKSPFVKSLFSSLVSLIRPSKTHDPEAQHSDWHNIRASDNNREPDMNELETDSRTPSSRSHELCESHEWTQFENGVSVTNKAEHKTAVANVLLE